MRTPAPHRREGLLLAIAVGVVGVTFGVLADAAGLSLPRIVVMSALVFTGASQFAAVSVVDGGGSGGAAVGSAMLLAARNALYGPVVDRVLPRSRPRRLVATQLVIDETTAMAAVQEDAADAADAFWWTGIWLWTLWNVGSVGGALLGSVIGDPETWGLDAAFPAAFVALLAPHLRTVPGRVAAGLGTLVAIGTVPLVAAGVPLLLAALAVVPAAWLHLRRSRSAGRRSSCSHSGPTAASCSAPRAWPGWAATTPPARRGSPGGSRWWRAWSRRPSSPPSSRSRPWRSTTSCRSTPGWPA